MSAIENQVEPVLRCEVRPHRESVIVAVIGELDLETVTLVEAELRDLHARGFESLLVDLADLSFIDSTGLHMLLSWTWAARDGGPQFGVLAGYSIAARRAFELAGLDEHLVFVAR